MNIIYVLGVIYEEKYIILGGCNVVKVKVIGFEVYKIEDREFLSCRIIRVWIERIWC